MTAMIEAPLDLMEAVANIRLPDSANNLLQQLMDRKTEGDLTEKEWQQLEALVDLSESMSLLRARALRVLGRQPM